MYLKSWLKKINEALIEYSTCLQERPWILQYLLQKCAIRTVLSFHEVFQDEAVKYLSRWVGQYSERIIL